MSLDIFKYPMPGFHFAVTFELFPQTPNDLRFQEVSGLDVSMETESFKEGGENRFTHELPVRTKYTNLVLKRGLFIGSGIRMWCINAIENFEFKPINVTVALLNELHIPVMAWYVVNAYPVKWKTSSFNAKTNELVVETLELKYNYFKIISLESLVSDAVTSAFGGSFSL